MGRGKGEVGGRGISTRLMHVQPHLRLTLTLFCQLEVASRKNNPLKNKTKQNNKGNETKRKQTSFPILLAFLWLCCKDKTEFLTRAVKGK